MMDFALIMPHFKMEESVASKQQQEVFFTALVKCLPVYRFSRTAGITDINRDFDLNDDYYLVYGFLTTGKL